VGLYRQEIVAMSYSKVEFGNQGGFNTGAGKGDAERPINRSVFRANLEKIKKSGGYGKVSAKKIGKTTYTYK
jgi:ABC-type amino acid transport substrate-binding protein